MGAGAGQRDGWGCWAEIGGLKKNAKTSCSGASRFCAVALREYLSEGAIEGVVWHHPDGRMVKIKGKDFGIKRKPANA